MSRRRTLLLLLLASLAPLGPARAAEPPRLRVLSYNVGAIPMVHRAVGARMQEIASRLAREAYDVVALQEVWLDVDAARIKKGWPYSLRHEAGLFGSGLLTLSRYPILASKFFPYTAGAAPHDFFLNIDGDALCTKGIVAARLQTPSGEIDVYNTHLIANDTPEENDVVRVTQVLELDRAIREFSNGRPYILLGDLNFVPGGEQYSLLKDLLGIDDPCWSEGKETCGGTWGPLRRIDYVLAPRAKAALAFAAPVPVRGIPMYLSDHTAGIEAVIALPLTGFGPGGGRLEALKRVRASLLEAAGKMRGRSGAFWSRWYVKWWNRRESSRLEKLTVEIESELRQREPKAELPAVPGGAGR